MCGITGVIGIEDHEKIVKASLYEMKNRGIDKSQIISIKNASFGHNLHSIVGYVEQPFENEKFVLAINCEIYNWKELVKKNKLNSKNDAELVFDLLKNLKEINLKILNKIIDEFDGVFAFFLYDKNKEKLYLTRDLLGVKPLFYSINTNNHDNNTDNTNNIDNTKNINNTDFNNNKKKMFFAFSSEKKTLVKNNFKIVKELNPRQSLEYDFKTNSLFFEQKGFFEIYPEINESRDEIFRKLEEKLLNAIKKRIPENQKFGILFSGGIDSTFIAYVCKKYNLPFICYTSAVDGFGDEASDLLMSKKIAKELDFPLKIKTVTLDELEEYIIKVSALIESNNVTKIGVALPFFIASEKASEDGIKVIFSGLGSEEIFAGYERHAMSAGIGKQGYDELSEYDKLDIGNVNKECLSGLMQIHERDLYRDDVVTMYNKIELRLPFLDKELIKYSLKIPAKYKISNDEKKIILRDISEIIGIPKEYARRPKKAAQYGSKFDKAIGKLARKKGFARKAEYLKQFYEEPNLKLGSLLSTGKDSIYASLVMMQRNYEISCFLTMKSSNEDSYMFHTPSIEFAKVQAKLSEIPIIIEKTKGNKEDELKDLRELILKAKNHYQIEGIVTGALFSTYQRDRIEKICDELGLICWNPLWHKNQIDYMNELIDNNIKFIMTKVMAEGLDENWINKVITKKEIKQLEELNKKAGLNVAGEGGEFETLVLDCPFFKKSIEIEEFKLIHDKERFETVTLDIQKIILKDK